MSRLILALLPILLAACVPISADARPVELPDRPVTAATESAIVNDPEVIAHLEAREEARIKSCDRSLTSAQRESVLDKVRPFFDGRTITLTGTVDDARNMNGTFDAIVTFDKVKSNVRIVVPEELALSLRRGDPVLLEGQLKIVGCGGFDELTGTLSP